MNLHFHIGLFILISAIQPQDSSEKKWSNHQLHFIYQFDRDSLWKLRGEKNLQFLHFACSTIKLLIWFDFQKMSRKYLPQSVSYKNTTFICSSKPRSPILVFPMAIGNPVHISSPDKTHTCFKIVHRVYFVLSTVELLKCCHR